MTRQTTTAKGWESENQKLIERLVLRKKHLRNVEIPNRFYGSEIVNDDGVITVREQHLPGLGGSLKYVAAGMGTEDWFTPMYAFLSDATHPTPYAALETAKHAATAEDDDLHQFGSADMRREYMILQAAVHAYQQAWFITTSYFGLDTDVVVRVCDKVSELPKPDSSV